MDQMFFYSIIFYLGLCVGVGMLRSSEKFRAKLITA